MSRYIKTDALMKDIWSLYRDEDHVDYNVAIADALNVIDEQPTADVVEVVRCKDCKHAEIQDYAPPSCRYCCKYSALYHAKNFYCSMGERREDDKG